MCTTRAPVARTRQGVGSTLKTKITKRLNHSLPVGDSSRTFSDVRFGSCKIFRLDDACTLYSATNVPDNGKKKKYTEDNFLCDKSKKDNTNYLTFSFCMNQLTITFALEVYSRVLRRDMGSDSLLPSFLLSTDLIQIMESPGTLRI